MIISHDRYFLDKICTHIMEFEGNGKVNYFVGTYSEYEQHKKSNLFYFYLIKFL